MLIIIIMFRLDEEQFDEYEAGLLGRRTAVASGFNDPEDDEADRIYAEIDEKMAERRKSRREANEEVGIMPEEISLLGALTSLYIPVSNFNVYPYLAYATTLPTYNLSENEVAHTLEIPLHELFAPGSKTKTDIIVLEKRFIYGCWILF